MDLSAIHPSKIPKALPRFNRRFKDIRPSRLTRPISKQQLIRPISNLQLIRPTRIPLRIRFGSNKLLILKDRILSNKDRILNSTDHILNSKEYIRNSKEYILNSNELSTLRKIVDGIRMMMLANTWDLAFVPHYCAVVL